ncbi:uncharacterized protein PFL1_04156 [Pseudozyma flocculosa PF-1]|uniref:SnoaL-like domain-containing protein n=1 Tax=Pseudozyma flocculosa PF-1 TaxID=1277687 RepID=A0A061H786_9BASI|nr:uncharacterized protein PFL1_04156 [Pseudozyma flocculosa PF-1]EPQ28329.1 hypothetical protein PFL1_04156 [Pseudozyma flocculosa PF-1]
MARFAHYPSTIPAASLDGPAPFLLILAPLDRGCTGLSTNLAEEGGKALAKAVLQRLSDEGIEWPQWNAIITVGLRGDDGSVVRHLQDLCPGSVGGWVHYGPLFTGSSDFPLPTSQSAPALYHLGSHQSTLLAHLTKLGDDGTIPRESFPFNPSWPSSSLRGQVGPSRPAAATFYHYESVSATSAADWAFSYPFSDHTRPFAFSPPRTDADRSAASLCYTRTLAFLKAQIGPRFPLESIWDRHTYFEFATKDSAATMSTMVPSPYVNHVATLTGGSGYDELARFYEHHFTRASPPDTRLLPVSRTVGSDRIVDEMVFECTHTTEIEYFLPGVAPTGKRLRIAMVGIINIRGDKLAFESLYWDQASTLAQLGLLPSGGSSGGAGGGSLPIAAGEVAQKVLDPYGQPSNLLLTRWKHSENLPVPPKWTAPPQS